MEINWLALLAASLSSLVVGFIWYNPKVFGNIWMKEAGINFDPAENFNMVKIFGLSIIYAFFISMFLMSVTIHQSGAVGMVGGDVAHAKPSFFAFMADYGTAFRTFKHGALHGFLTGLFLVIPTVGVSALYEKRSFKYVLISGGYWAVSCAIMGGIICGWK
jgi:Protein of unknown function (DUF1761)